MDVIKKLNELRLAKGWTINKLAFEAMLTQSTVANLFAKGYDPKLSTLSALCEALDITLADFFYDSAAPDTPTPQDKEILRETQRLNQKQKKLLIEFLREFNSK